MSAITMANGATTIDLEASLGFNLTDDGRYRDAAVAIPGEVEIPLVPGVTNAGPDRVKAREFTCKGYLNGASRAAVEANLLKLEAISGIGDGSNVVIVLGGWSTVQITARCVDFKALNYPLNGRGNSQNEIPVAVEMTFRTMGSPYWQDVTPQSVGFTTSAVAMPQGTAPSYPVLTTTAGAITTPVITCKDYTGATLWTATLASLLAGERYRITTAPGTMTIEKYTSGAWTNSDASLTAGIFPKPLPSSAIGYQTSAWPTLQATSGSWTADYSRQWV